MPTYDYKCRKCGTVFELFQKMSDPPEATCPKCGGKAERQLSGGHGIVFKGSGFYETDYKRAGAKQGKKDGGPDAGPATGPGEAAAPKGPSTTPPAKD
jgi:putative FmdB family regulatory protein